MFSAQHSQLHKSSVCGLSSFSYKTMWLHQPWTFNHMSMALHAWEDVEIATAQYHLLACHDTNQPSLIHSQRNVCVIDSYIPGRGKRGQSSLCLKYQLLWRGQCAIKKNIHQDAIINILITNWSKLFLNTNWGIIKWFKSSIKSSLYFLHISDFQWCVLEIPRE